MVQCVLDLGGPVCFFLTSVSQCVFGPQWFSVFWTSVVRCVSDLSSLVCFRTLVVWCVSDLGGPVCFLDLDCPVHFWTSVV